MNQELINKIKEDLEKSGFSSELRARKILIDNKWSVSAGYAYQDKDENKSREIDILATKSVTLHAAGDANVYSEFHICGEVKKTEKPWIVFDQKKHPALLSCAWTNLISVINLPDEKRFFKESLADQSLIKINGWEGSSIHESFKTPDQPSRWYSAFVTAAKAAEAFLKESTPHGNEITDNFNNSCELHFVQPLIILNGPLFKAVLAPDGSIEITEIDNAAFNFDYKTQQYRNSPYRIDLVTLEGLPKYLDIITLRQKNIVEKIKAITIKRQSK